MKTMNLKSFFIAAFVLTGFAGNAWAQTDVTNTYLTNADFSIGTSIDNNVCTYGKDMAINETTYYGAQAISGWTNASVGETDTGYANSKLAGALFAYGSTPWIGGSGTPAPATDPNGNPGNAVGLCSVWGGSVQYTQDVTLPAGSYTIVFKVYNATTNNGSGKFITTNLFGFVENGGTTHYAPNKTFAIGQWSTVAVTFNLAVQTEGKISMGFVGPSGNANMPHLFVDNVKILLNEFYDDVTNKVGVEANTNWIDASDGMQGNGVTTDDGRNTKMAARYGTSATGTVIYQDITGLDNGSYEVTVFAYSQNEWNNNGASLTHDAGDVGVVFAEGAYKLEEWINARRGPGYPADGPGIYTISGVKVTDGSLKLGYEIKTANQTEWHAIQIKSLIHTNPINLSSYKEARDVVKNLANEAIATNLVPTACEEAIQTAIDTYGGEYYTEEDYTNAKEQIQSALDTYFTDVIKFAYAAYYSFKAKVEGLMSGVDDGEPKLTFTNALSTATNNVEAATAAAAITSETADIRSAAMTFISTTDNHQFDITFLASQNYADWKKKDGSAAGEVTWAVTNRGDWTFAESYEETCATTGTVLYQTVSDLPEGYYQVGMYAMAAYTPGRGFASEATEGDANRSFAFAGNLEDASSILRTGIAIPFKTTFDFSELTTLDVNVHFTSTGDLTFGVQKDANGSNWHFAQIASIVYSKDPDLTNLKATRDALVAEALGLLNGSSEYLTPEQQGALQEAIDAGNAANSFDALNMVTLTTLPDAINTARQQVQQVQTNRVLMLAALERFENEYNLADGTDYSRMTMSAKAWTDLIAKVNAVTTALDDVSQATSYGTLKDELISQMDATDASIRLFKSYKAMADGALALGISEGATYSADSFMDSDAGEQAAIDALNAAFVTYATAQDTDFNVAGYLGDNLDFSAEEGAALNSDNDNNIHSIAGWEVVYTDADTWATLQTHQSDNDGKLYIRKNWGSAATMLTVAKQKMLPEGKYRLTLSWNSDMANMTNLSAFVVGVEQTTIGETTAEPTTLTYEFEVKDGAQPFDLVFGFTKSGTGNTPAQIIVDDITLTYLTSTKLKGDVNKDKRITIADVTALVNIILGKDDTPPYVYDHDAADVNVDKKVTIADVTALVNIILGKKSE